MLMKLLLITLVDYYPEVLENGDKDTEVKSQIIKDGHM